ncbi:MAG: DUF2865 domain-containing protein [Pseudomonadota bacterium]
MAFAFGALAADLRIGSHTATTAATAMAANSTAKILDDNAWLKSLRTERFWQKKRKKKSTASLQPKLDLRNRRSLGRIVRGTDNWNRQRRSLSRPAPRKSYSTTYRTVCVRLCDGFYYPVSPSTTRGRFNRDSGRCATSCAAPTRLYYHRAAGNASEMVDLSGRKYVRLPTAFLYRTAYNPNCQCRANPWSQESKDRHQIYAWQKERRKHRRNRTKRRELAKQIKGLRKQVASAKKARSKSGKVETKSTVAAADVDDRDARVDKYMVKATVRQNAAVITLDAVGAAKRESLTKANRTRAVSKSKRSKTRAASTRRSAVRRRTKAKRVARRAIPKPKFRLGARPAKRAKRRVAVRRAPKSNWRQNIWKSD